MILLESDPIYDFMMVAKDQQYFYLSRYLEYENGRLRKKLPKGIMRKIASDPKAVSRFA